jgi:hypothetical protein
MAQSSSPFLRAGAVLALLAGGLAAWPAAATQTVCSNPRRAGVRAAAWTWRIAGGEAALVRALHAFAGQAGLSVSGVGVRAAPGKGDWRVNLVILQSPRYTLALMIEIDSRRRAVALRVERTCINDAPIEAWAPYWRGLLSCLRARGYSVSPAPPVRPGSPE